VQRFILLVASMVASSVAAVALEGVPPADAGAVALRIDVERSSTPSGLPVRLQVSVANGGAAAVDAGSPEVDARIVRVDAPGPVLGVAWHLDGPGVRVMPGDEAPVTGTLAWDGRTLGGSPVPDGLYAYQAETILGRQRLRAQAVFAVGDAPSPTPPVEGLGASGAAAPLDVGAVAAGYSFDYPRWSVMPVEWRYNAGGEPSPESLRRIQDGFEAWNAEVGPTFGFRYAGPTTSNGFSPSDGFNVASWGSPGTPTALAGSACYEDLVDTNRILQCDVVFDATILAGFAWNTGTDAPSCTEYDLWSIASHEAGHWLELNHVNDPGDEAMTMWPTPRTCDAGPRDLAWGDRSGARYAYPNDAPVPGVAGEGIQDVGTDAADFDGDGRLDLLIGWMDDAGGASAARYRIGWGIGAQDGRPESWSPVMSAPAGGGGASGGLGVAAGQLDGAGGTDALFIWAESAITGDALRYRVLWDVGADGEPGRVGSAWEVPGTIGFVTRGVGACLDQLDADPAEDLVVAWADDALVHNLFYRIGWNLDSSGAARSWTNAKAVGGGSLSGQPQGVGVTCMQLLGPANGAKEIVVAYVDHPLVDNPAIADPGGVNRISLRVGENPGADGDPEAWSVREAFANVGLGSATRGLGLGSGPLDATDVDEAWFVFADASSPPGAMSYRVDWNMRWNSHP
jgi:hypothetical protein